MMALKMEERNTSEEYWWSLKAGKGKKLDSPLEASQRNAVLLTALF